MNNKIRKPWQTRKTAADETRPDGTSIRYVKYGSAKRKSAAQDRDQANKERYTCKGCGGTFDYRRTSSYGRVAVNQDGSEHAPTCPQNHGHVGQWVGVPAAVEG